MPENAFIINREKKLIEKPTGLEEYCFSEEFATEIIEKADLDIFRSIVNEIMEEGEEEEEEEFTIDIQRWASIFEITQRPETIAFASLGFPSNITHYYSPSVIQWCDRMISLQSYDENGITLYPSMLGADDFPMKVGIEVIGNAIVIPSYIYKPLVFPDLRKDRGIFVTDYDEESFTLEAFHTEIDTFPLLVGVFVTGKINESDSERQEWYIEVTMTSRVQSFDYASSNIGKIDDYFYDVPFTLETPEQTFYWHQLQDINKNSLPSSLSNPRISRLGFRAECGGYISTCTSQYVTMKRMHWWKDDLPVKFNLQVRGGVNA